MRIVEKVLYGFGGLLALMLFFVALCHYNPGIAVKLGAILKVDAANETLKSDGETNAGMLVASTTVTVGELGFG